MRAIVLGSGGMLGGELLRQFEKDSSFEAIGFSHSELNVLDSESLRNIFEQHHPDVVWNCVAYNAVDRAETDLDAANELNAKFPEKLAKLSKEFGAKLVHFSSGYIFDGKTGNGYQENSEPAPINAYGQSKLVGEKVVSENINQHYIIRLNWLFGKPGSGAQSKKSFPDMVIDLANKESSEPLRMVSDEIATPTFAEDLAIESIRLVKEDEPFGIYHLTNSGQASWYDFANETLKLNGISVQINPISSRDLKRAAIRPKNAVLLNTKHPVLRDWREALAAYYNTSI